MQQTGVSPPSLSVLLDRSCSTCGHIRVCSIFRTITPYLEQQFTELLKPFDANDVAKICKAYLNSTVLTNLQEGR